MSLSSVIFFILGGKVLFSPNFFISEEIFCFLFSAMRYNRRRYMISNTLQTTSFRLSALTFLVFWVFFAVFHLSLPQFSPDMLSTHSEHMDAEAQHHQQTSRECISVCLTSSLNSQRAMLSFLLPSELAQQMDPALSLLPYDHLQRFGLFLSGLFFVWFALRYLRRLFRRCQQILFELLSRGILGTPRSSL